MQRTKINPATSPNNTHALEVSAPPSIYVTLLHSLTYARHCSLTRTIMSIRNCTFIRAVAHPPLTNSTVAPLCKTYLIFHWAGDCPAPCASEWPCSLKLFAIDPWPCAKCFSATQNKLASGPWDLPIFRKSFILHSRMHFPNVGLLPRQRPRPAPIICTNCRV